MKRKQLRLRRLGLVLACGMLIGAVSVEAKKPPAPPPEPEPPVDTGEIYAAIEGDIVALPPDGSGEQYLFTPPEGMDAMGNEPSRFLHNGERWFVCWQHIEGWYPDGVSPRRQLIAISDSGDLVVLHDDLLLQPSRGYPSTPHWMPDDSAVTWPAMRWGNQPGDTIIEWGVYALDLTFNTDGSIAVETPVLIDWTAGLFELWYEEPPSPYLEGYYLLVNDFDWSPDGSAIVYSASFSDAFERQLYVADAGGSDQLTFDADTYPTTPRWSPDGSRIVFQLNEEQQFDVIDLVAEQRYTLLTTSRTDGRERIFLPVWSPSSTHLAYTYFTAGPRLLWRKSALHIIAADGSGDTALTGTYTSACPLGWLGD